MLFYSRLKNSLYIKNIINLLSGTLAAQFILVAFSPILTRLYEPSEIGLYSSITAITAFFTPLINARYEFLIVPAKDEDNAKEFALLSFILCSALTVLLTIVTLMLKVGNVSFVKDFSLFYLFFIALIVYINGLTNIFNQYNNRLKQYKSLSKVTLYRTLAQVTSQLFFGLLKLGSIGLILSILLGTIVGLKKQVSISIGKFKSLFVINKTNLFSLFKSNINQLSISLPAALINTATNNLLVPIVTLNYGLVISGFYYMATRIMAMPVQIFGSTLSKLHFEQACREYDKYDHCKKSFYKSVFMSSILMVGISIIVYIFSEPFFKFFFGSQWINSAFIVKILIPYYFIRAVALSVIMTPYVFKFQFLDFINQILILSNLLVSLVISHTLNLDYLGFFKVYNWSGFVAYFFVILICWYTSLGRIKIKRGG